MVVVPTERFNLMGVPTHEIKFTRVFDAPRDRVWRAWTDPEILKLWCGPKNYTVPLYSVDLRVGGKTFNCIRTAEGQEICSAGTYLEIVEGKHLLITDNFSDKEGNIVPASTYGMFIDWPSDAKIDLTFEDLEGKTLLSLKQFNVPVEDSDLTEKGWKEYLDRLEEYLK
jgi:uncharacterized protein YndB with AHSA1/START domain